MGAIWIRREDLKSELRAGDATWPRYQCGKTTPADNELALAA